MTGIEKRVPSWLERTSARGWTFIIAWALLFALIVAASAVALGHSGTTTTTVFFLGASSLPALMMLATHATRMILRLVLPRACRRPLTVIADPLVVIPVILRRECDVDNLRLCVNSNLPYVERRPLALLIDLADAATEFAPGDAALRESTCTCFASEIANGDVVVLFRTRRYDPVDRVWRGWERKRGKIEAFCRWLRGDTRCGFFGDLPSEFHGLDALLTIDLDSRLNARTVKGLVGAVDVDAAIVAPTINVFRYPGATFFERLQVPWLWTQPFVPRETFNQSHLGWDLFHGKGLILIDRFLQRTQGRIPERTMLSHDIVEATLAGAVSTPNATVGEPIPPTRAHWARRQARWIRGDLQNLRWIFRRDLPTIMRFHLLEVAVVHVVPLGCVAGTIVALMAAPSPAANWIVLSNLLLLHPPLVLAPLVAGLQVIETEGALPNKCRMGCGALVVAFTSAVLAILYAPRNAILAARAALLVAWRMGWSGRNMLAWDDAAAANHLDLGQWRAVAAVGGVPAALWALLRCTGAVQAVGALILLWLMLPDLLHLRPSLLYGQGPALPIAPTHEKNNR